MIKWFKKHCKKLIIASSILTVCICGLFGFTKSYAYNYNPNNDTLVGNNAFATGDGTNYVINGLVNDSGISSYFNVDTYGNPFIEFEFNNYSTANLISIKLYNSDLFGQGDIRFRYCDCILVQPNFTSFNNNAYLSTFVGALNSNFGEYRQSEIFNTNLSSIQPNYNCIYTKNNYSFGTINNYYYGFITILNNNNGATLNGTLRLTYMCFESSTLNTSASISSNTTSYIPYSSIEQLQEAYDSLQQQYNDYVSTHSYSNTQYNDLVSANSSLQQQLSSLQLQYDTYVATHSHTDEDYNTLQQNYNTLNTTLTQLQNDYNSLQQRYDELYASFDDIYKNKNHGYFNFLDYIEFHNGDYSSGRKTVDDLVDDNVLYRLFLDVNSAFQLYVAQQPSTNYIDIYFLPETVPLELFELDFYEFSVATIDLEFYNVVTQQTRSVSIILGTNNNVIDGYAILRALWGDDFTKDQYDEYIKNVPATLYITYIEVYGGFSTSGEIWDTSINSVLAIDGASYNFGYEQGYGNATRESNTIKAENTSLKGTISTLENNNNQLQSDYNNLNSNYQNLRKSYNDLLSGRNDLSTLFFTIAQTPFETFKTIWNVDFLGVNLAGFFTGIIMLGLMLWIVKKIF